MRKGRRLVSPPPPPHHPTASSHKPNHCISANSCNSWTKRFRGISVAPKTTSSCLKLSQLSSYPPHCISANSCDRPGRHLIHCNYSCQFVQFVGKKNISNNSWAIIHSLLIAPAKDNFKVVSSCPCCRHILPSLH